MNKNIAREYVEKLKEINEKYSDDPERHHVKADEVILDLLYDLGYQIVVDAYNNYDIWWYA